MSTDGRVTLWSVSKNELSWQDVLMLRGLRGREDLLAPPPASKTQPRQQQQQHAGGSLRPEGSTGGAAAAAADPATPAAAVGIAGGCCFDFNREQDYLFVVGCEDGSLFKCSTAYASEYLAAYRPGHAPLPVYAVRWSALHPRAFLSAGADWRVKLWDSLLDKVCDGGGWVWGWVGWCTEGWSRVQRGGGVRGRRAKEPGAEGGVRCGCWHQRSTACLCSHPALDSLFPPHTPHPIPRPPRPPRSPC